MQTARIVQAVILMMIVALAASCAASKEYTSKLFGTPVVVAKDSQAVAIRFLELDNLEPDKDNLVSTDIITGRDTTANSIALDNFAVAFPAITDSTAKTRKEKTIGALAENKIPAADSIIVAKGSKPGEIRNKKIRE